MISPQYGCKSIGGHKGGVKSGKTLLDGSGLDDTALKVLDSVGFTDPGVILTTDSEVLVIELPIIAGSEDKDESDGSLMLDGRLIEIAVVWDGFVLVLDSIPTTDDTELTEVLGRDDEDDGRSTMSPIRESFEYLKNALCGQNGVLACT